VTLTEALLDHMLAEQKYRALSAVSRRSYDEAITEVEVLCRCRLLRLIDQGDWVGALVMLKRMCGRAP
jgi:hypothetical protein